MLEKADFYYFSPTGGTKKVGEVFAGEVARTVCPWELGKKETRKNEAELLVVAVPVFGGRIPGVAAQRLQKLDGQGKQAVTLVVYGTRAYEDALLELNDVITDCGFQVVASGAFVAQHSMAPQVGPGRPDGADEEELRVFARRVLEKIEGGQAGKVEVPGNRPYKPQMQMPATPICLPSCTRCGACAAVCPTEAVAICEDSVQTKVEKCILCMACTVACPENARVLPAPLRETMEQKLGVLKDVRRENEVFL